MCREQTCHNLFADVSELVHAFISGVRTRFLESNSYCLCTKCLRPKALRVETLSTIDTRTGDCGCVNSNTTCRAPPGYNCFLVTFQIRRAELISKLPGITAYSSSSSTNTTTSQSTSSGVRRSTRLFGSTPSNTSLNDSTDKIHEVRLNHSTL